MYLWHNCVLSSMICVFSTYTLHIVFFSFSILYSAVNYLYSEVFSCVFYTYFGVLEWSTRCEVLQCGALWCRVHPLNCFINLLSVYAPLGQTYRTDNSLKLKDTILNTSMGRLYRGEMCAEITHTRQFKVGDWGLRSHCVECLPNDFLCQIQRL